MYESIYNAPLLQPKQSRVRAKFHSGLMIYDTGTRALQIGLLITLTLKILSNIYMSQRLIQLIFVTSKSST